MKLISNPREVVIDNANCDPAARRKTAAIPFPVYNSMVLEPLPNEHIINIQGYVGSEPFNCEGSECAVPLPSHRADRTARLVLGRIQLWRLIRNLHSPNQGDPLG